MRGVEVPEPEEDFTADPVELFFDLAYVFAFSRLVYQAVHHPTWSGMAELLLLFTMIWLSWSQFTWSANAVSGNTRPVRAIFLVATVVCVPIGGSVTDALTNEAGRAPLVFAASVGLILALGLVTMLVAMSSSPEGRRPIQRYATLNLAAVVLFCVGALFSREVRIWLWVIGLAVVLYAMMRAGDSAWIIRPGHFAERHGLIVIIALGEIIVAIGLTTIAESGELGRSSEIALVAAGAFAALLWWNYFDRPNPAIEHFHHSVEDGRASATLTRDVYTLAHVPIVGGIILAAAGLEEIALHPTEDLPVAFRLMLIAGIVLFLSGIGVAVYRTFRVFARERIAAGVVLAVLVGFGGSMSGLTLLILIDLVLVLMIVAEQLRIEGTLRNPFPVGVAER